MSRKHVLAPIRCFILLASVVSQPSWPYDLNTHRAINDGAVIRSSLDDYLTEVLNLQDGIATTFNDRDVRDWIREGGAFEDQPIRRAANHFHYPLRPWDQALLTDFPGSVAAVESSVLWVQNPNQRPFLGQEDPWSWVNARRDFFDALTLTDGTEREVAFGRTFRALGQVLHLVADGSVPAHARNDSHVLGEPIETWLEAQARRNGTETPEQARARFLATFAPTSVPFAPGILGATPDPLAPIPIAKVFDTDTYDGTEATLGLTTSDAVGITEFTNANFFSDDTIFADTFIRNERFSPFPSRTNVEKFIDPANNHRYWRKTGPGVPVEHLATVSLLDRFRQGPPLTGGLDPVVHDEYARLLVPRAVGYSTGLIDYFFRGRLEAVDPEFTDTGVNLKVKNAIDAEEVLEWQNESLYRADTQGNAGQFVLTLKYKRGEVEELIASEPVNLTGQELIKPGETSNETLSFSLPAPPDDATDIEYRLVFRGRLGEEDDAVAVGLVAPTSGFLVSPSYVPSDGIRGSRLVVHSGGKWRVTQDRDLEVGNIDWKGAYKNGRPTKVLSWRGPSARHFPNQFGGGFRPDIYQGGERFAVAPCGVLGAAITKDATGKEWLVTICSRGRADVAFRRPNIQSDSNTLFDPVTNPDGWQEIGNFPYKPDFKFANRPWFFNGAGTEAQTMREDDSDLENGLTRLKITLTGNAASIANLGNREGVTGTTFTSGNNSEISPVPDTRCRGGTLEYSLSEHYGRTNGGNARGSYVVAVDYNDNQEILATISHSADSARSETSDRNEEVFVQCAGNLYHWFTSDVTGHRELISSEDSTSTLSLGTVQIRLATNRHNLKAVSKLNRSRLHDFQDPERDYDNKTWTNTYTKSGDSEQVGIIYLDMRHDLAVVRSYRSTHTATGGNQDTSNTWLITSQNTIEEKVEIRRPEGTIPVFNSTSSSTGTSTRAPPFTPLSPDSPPSEFEFGPRAMSGWLALQRRQGSWAVTSNGNLFVSQEYQDENLQTKYFNFLTDGNLEALIPGATENTRYFPGGVVK